MLLQCLVLQHHGSKIIPDRVIFQDLCKGEREVRPRSRAECQEDGPGAQCHEDRPTDESEAANSFNVNHGVVNFEQGTLMGPETFRSSIKERKTLGGTGISCQKWRSD